MRPMRVLAVLCLVALGMCQSDGNPWKWDRLRRCDNEDYSPQCGLCEGIGGDAWSDKNEDIKITKCTPVALPHELPESVQKDYPLFDKTFIQTRRFAVQINDKTNFACIGGFPGPDSTKEHCYSRQTGVMYYDWTQYRLKLELSVYGTLFNTSTTVTHANEHMWISNDFKITKQCICTDPGRSNNIKLYPIQYDFMAKDSRFVGREKLWVEFLEQEMLVDHWTKGPHHIWKDVATNKIVRMWQPWNGLEVWHPDHFLYGDNSAHFQVPPTECIPAWYKPTIKCDDHGYPQSPNSLLF